jgi:hypothetical protein
MCVCVCVFLECVCVTMYICLFQVLALLLQYTVQYMYVCSIVLFDLIDVFMGFFRSCATEVVL